MASGGRKKLFGSVISGAPFIKGLQLLDQRGFFFIGFHLISRERGSILVELYFSLCTALTRSDQ